MGATVQGILLTGDHASRPSSGLEYGTIYACSTHYAIEQTTDTGSTWVTWPGLGTTAPNPTTIELGHASDTTLARIAAGRVSIEGDEVYKVGGTDVALADGGTGASLVDPNADRILFWDDSAGSVAFLTPGTNLTITTTTIDAAGGGAGTWGAFTPTLTGSVTNPTLGTGGSATGRYVQDGKTVHAMGEIIFGSSGVAAGSGEYRIALPVNEGASIVGRARGVVNMYDDSAGKFMQGVAFASSSSVFRITIDSFDVAGLVVTDSIPWTWAANDQIQFNLTYEGA